MLCVSAVEGVMPQTREHLAILQLLGVRHGLVAMTMCDLADEEMRELAADDARDAIEGTFLEDAPMLFTSAQTGEGLEALREALDAGVQVKRDTDGPFRLPVDRSFVQRGFGVVVTGTTLSGQVRDGAELAILPGGAKARVRGIQVHGDKQPSSHAGLRTALNLAGPTREELPRGTVVAHPSVPVTSMMDVALELLDSGPGVNEGDRVRLLIGTAEVMARAYLVNDRYAQIRTAAPIVAMNGDRFVLRRESPVTTLGGGTVLDVWAPRLRKKDCQAASAQLARLEAGEVGVLLERAGLVGLSSQQAKRRGVEGLALADRVLSEGAVAAHTEALLTGLTEFHAENPLALGAPRRALRRGRLEALGNAAFDALLERTEGIVLEGPRVRLPDWSVELSAAQQAEKTRLLALLKAQGWEPLKFEELHTHGFERALVELLLDTEELIRVAGRLYLSTTLTALIATVRGVLAKEGELSPTQFKELTGLTRRGAIPLLEWLDAQKVTRREGDVRVEYR
jgi:selenocysteine-specific elongation factor